MAEQTRSYRAIDQQPGREIGGHAAEGHSDPLAELARLIGQTDPFADRDRSRADPAYDADPRSPQPGWRSRSGETQYASADGAYVDEPYPAQHAIADDNAYPASYDPYYVTEQEGIDEADDQHQQDLGRPRRRRLATVVAIVGLAVIGGAAAYGYRTYVSHTPNGSAPPVIMADSGPTKVIPVAKAGEASANKLSYERVGAPGQPEKVVPREEKPVDVKAAAVTPPRAPYSAPEPGAMPPAPRPTVAVTGTLGQNQALPAASSAAPPIGSGVLFASAKKVKTVTIRPDMSVVAAMAAPKASPPPARDAAGTRGVTLPASSARAGDSAGPQHNAPARPLRHASAPLSLTPGDAEANGSTRAPTTSTRSIGPVASAEPTNAAEPKTAALRGGFAVQISSQRSEADAKASFRVLQSRFSSVLGGRQHYVKRADLGSRGVYYRTLIGPFATADQAAAFCASLKAAGGQCLIHRN